MLTAEYVDSGMIKIHNGDTAIALINVTHTLKDGESFPVKSITFDEDKIRVEVERPLSLVEAVGKCHGFGKHTQPHPKWSKGMLAVYEAWKRENKNRQETK